MWCINAFKLFYFSFGIFNDTFSYFHIGTIIAWIAYHKFILAYICNKHEFMCNTSAHHTWIGLHWNYLRYSCTGKYSFISLMTLSIIFFKVFLSKMEGICVFHGKLSYSDKTASWTGFITEFRLYLIHHERIIHIRFRCMSCKMYNGFFMCHSQNHVNTASVFKPQQFRADTFKSARLFPESCRHSHGH